VCQDEGFVMTTRLGKDFGWRGAININRGNERT